MATDLLISAASLALFEAAASIVFHKSVQRWQAGTMSCPRGEKAVTRRSCRFEKQTRVFGAEAPVKSNDRHKPVATSPQP